MTERFADGKPSGFPTLDVDPNENVTDLQSWKNDQRYRAPSYDDFAAKFKAADRHQVIPMRMLDTAMYGVFLGEILKIVDHFEGFDKDMHQEEIAIHFLSYGWQLGHDFVAEFGPMRGLSDTPEREIQP